MPQKRSPVARCYIHPAVAVLRQHAAALLDAMVSDHERCAGPWQIERIVLPGSFRPASGALARARYLLEGLQADEARMRSHIDLTGGLVRAEAVMMGLGRQLGRETAHDLVQARCTQAVQRERPLIELLAEHPRSPRISSATNWRSYSIQ